MTVPNEDTGYDTDAYDFETEKLTPDPLFIAMPMGRKQAAHYGSLTGVPIPADSAVNQPVQLLNRRPLRNQAVISNPVNAVNNPVVLSNGPGPLQVNPPLGYQLDSGQAIKIESQQPVWAIAGVGAAGVTINVLDEAYEGETGYE